MAVVSSQKSVTTTATLIASSDADGSSVAVTNTSSETVYLGPSGVTTSNGYPLAQNAAIGIELQASEKLYGIVGTGTSTVGCVGNRGVTLA